MAGLAQSDYGVSGSGPRFQRPRRPDEYQDENGTPTLTPVTVGFADSAERMDSRQFYANELAAAPDG